MILVLQIDKCFAVPTFYFIEFLDYCFPDRFAAHIHRDETGGENRAVLVAVYFLENESENRRVDQGFVVFLDVLRSLTGKIVSIEKLKEIMKSVHFAGPPFPKRILDDSAG